MVERNSSFFLVTMESSEFDVIVVGGGIMGVSTAFNLQLSGRRCLLLEQYKIGHIHGSSHGDGRIVRAADFHDIYLQMGSLSLKLWAELEERQKVKLLHLSGLLVIGRGKEGLLDLADCENNLKSRKFKYTVLNNEESNKKYPQFRLSPEDRAIYSDDGGMVFADKAIQAYYKEAVKLGATIKQYTVIEKIDHSSSTSVKVVCANGSAYSAKRVILCSGSWTNDILSRSGLKTVPMKILNEQVSYFNLKKGAPAIDYTIRGNMPAFIIVGDHSVYGMPHVTNSVEGVKISSHTFSGNTPIEPIADLETKLTQREYTMSLPRLKLTQNCLASYFPHLDPNPINIARCLYQKSPDGHFYIDKHVEDERVIIATGFSGTGFKHAPVVGLILTQLANGEPTVIDIKQLSMTRFDAKSKL